MQKKYDFVLFENYIGAINHYSDLIMTAKLLRFIGNSVAIVKYTDEDKYCKVDGIPIIEIKNKYKRPNDKWTNQKNYKIYSLFCMIRFLYQQHRYASNFLEQINGIAKNYYIGTYHLLMANVFVTKTLSSCNYYYWGVRSSKLTDLKEHFFRNPILGIKGLLFRHFFKRNENLNFFVSDNFIKEEFISLGIKKDHLVLKPERMIYHTPENNINLLSSRFSLLSIGLLREEKRLELSINAFTDLDDPEMFFTIAGRSSKWYCEKIDEIISNNKNILRINKFIQKAEYIEIIEKSHFVVFCDKKEKYSVTNGTMMEALILNRPIIAPNYLPFSYYVNKYNIGLLFNPDDKNSLISQIKHAKELGTEYFIPHIRNFQKTLLFEICANEFIKELKVSLNKTKEIK